MKNIMCIIACTCFVSNLSGQVNNTWLLRTYTPFIKSADSIYCYDFNTCPMRYKKIYMERDTNYLGHIQHSIYNHIFCSSFCDSTGQIVFTHLSGHHFYNKDGKIYDTTYINNNRFTYYTHSTGAFVEKDHCVYFFQLFKKLKTAPLANGVGIADSILITMSKFSHSGSLLSKNKIICQLPLITKRYANWMDIKGTLLSDGNIEVIVGDGYDPDNHFRVNFNVLTSTASLFPPLPVNDNFGLSYSTDKNMAVALERSSAVLLKRQANSDFVTLLELFPHNFKTPVLNYTYVGFNDFCFSPNDSIIYAILDFDNKVKGQKTQRWKYLIAFKLSNPLKDYKVLLLRDYQKDTGVGGNIWPLYFKLGPDGCIYIGGGELEVMRFRIVHPNDFNHFKIEKMPDISRNELTRGKVNFSLGLISTLDDYKRVEYSAYPTCRGLEMAFYNRCDTQHFKRYRLFFGNGDSSEVYKQDWPFRYTYSVPGKYFVRLKAFSKIGGFIWYGDSIEIQAPPKAAFGIKSSKGCQWIAHHFSDSSQYNTIKPGFSPWKRWYFGDGRDSVDAASSPGISHVYTQSGLYTAKLVLHNGWCTDTAVRINAVDILPAPRPGVIANPLTGCTPLKVDFNRTYSDPLDSAFWRSGIAGAAEVNLLSGSFVYPQSGNYMLRQRLHGSSGCITRDSLWIRVNPGISGMPDLLTATVKAERTVNIHWKPTLNAERYSLYSNKLLLASTSDTLYFDETANTLQSNHYTLKAFSTCNDSTIEEDLARTILLSGKREDKEATLFWTPYENWENGILKHELHLQNNEGGFELLATLGGNVFQYTDENFSLQNLPQKCYRITSFENLGNHRSSESNIICIPLKPLLVLPNAFSPNGDGINDTWGIDYQGVKQTEIRIFNRWGELIYHKTTDKPGWDGKYQGLTVPAGSYPYFIEAIGMTGEKVRHHGRVEVFR